MFFNLSEKFIEIIDKTEQQPHALAITQAAIFEFPSKAFSQSLSLRSSGKNNDLQMS